MWLHGSSLQFHERRDQPRLPLGRRVGPAGLLESRDQEAGAGLVQTGGQAQHYPLASSCVCPEALARHTGSWAQAVWGVEESVPRGDPCLENCCHPVFQGPVSSASSVRLLGRLDLQVPAAGTKMTHLGTASEINRLQRLEGLGSAFEEPKPRCAMERAPWGLEDRSKGTGTGAGWPGISGRPVCRTWACCQCSAPVLSSLHRSQAGFPAVTPAQHGGPASGPLHQLWAPASLRLRARKAQSLASFTMLLRCHLLGEANQVLPLTEAASPLASPEAHTLVPGHLCLALPFPFSPRHLSLVNITRCDLLVWEDHCFLAVPRLRTPASRRGFRLLHCRVPPEAREVSVPCSARTVR